MSLADEQEQTLISNERNFSTVKALSNGSIVINRDSQLQVVDDTQKKTAVKSQNRVVFAERGKIALYDNGLKKILTPAGDGFYLWPSLSPDGSRILFNKPGQGTFISTLDGTVLAALGYIVLTRVVGMPG